MITAFNHISMKVKDIQETLNFYQEYFGAVFSRGLYIPGGHTVGVYVQLGSNMVEFLSPLKAEEGTRYGIDHIAFTVDDVEEEAFRLLGKGYQFPVMPRTAGSGSGKIAFLLDPNGISVELVERAESFKQSWAATPDIRDIDHASIYAQDLPGAIAFYTGELGFNLLRHIRDEGRKFDMVYLNKGKNILQLLHFEEQKWEAPLMGHIGILVRDTKKLAEKFRTKGFEVSEPKELAVVKNGYVCTVKDPNGISIELIDRVTLFEMLP
jgi:catechol 2,3-dioxygenase-like lactoylglutathione lyase family enzyme